MVNKEDNVVFRRNSIIYLFIPFPQITSVGYNTEIRFHVSKKVLKIVIY